MMMEAHTIMEGEKIPTVNISILVYNSMNYLKQALQSLLAQIYKDFESIITDNASTDRSGEIGQKNVALDPRVRYFQNETNLGCTGNSSSVFKYARGKYYYMGSHSSNKTKRSNSRTA
jgi:GT2 family glycosyltransferase